MSNTLLAIYGYSIHYEKLTVLLWDEIFLQIVFSLPNPTVTVKNEAWPICTIIDSHNNLSS